MSDPQQQPAPTSAPAQRLHAPPDGGYAQDVHSAWTEFLQLLSQQARILDLGIGNHVPALVAADFAVTQQREWRIDAIDPGTPASERGAHEQERFDRIVFHAGSSWARLPFEDEAFDAVCGHHALEFSDAPAVLAEVHRVLKHGGDAQFLMHHSESPVVQAAHFSLREADLVFGKTKAFRRVHRLVGMNQVVPGTTERATDEVRTAIRTLKRGLQVARSQGGGRVLSVALDSIQQLLAARRDHRPDASALAVDRAEAELRASVRRLGQLVACARSEADMRNLETNAVAVGFTQVEQVALPARDGQPIAWQLLLHRP